MRLSLLLNRLGMGIGGLILCLAGWGSTAAYAVGHGPDVFNGCH